MTAASKTSQMTGMVTMRTASRMCEYDSDDDGPARRRGPPTRVARRKAVTPKSASNSDLFACPLPTLHRSWYVVHSLDLLAVLPVFVLENVVCATAHANWTLPGDLLSFETCPLLRPDELSGHIVFKTAATRRLSGCPSVRS
ncbi:hypothetical protein PsYK624_055120 [Phanerochaete sordida]|uniref:Uncharacterized protein n=1 Tax=Phanerochaete sordida TaxID=48140 RepID=A0A9P3LBE8_9APHY|nr:hypothetical protein PsYK624_055120 [Phanerochaete sordida]